MKPTALPNRRHISRWSLVYVCIGLVGFYFFLPKLQGVQDSIQLLFMANVWLVVLALLLTAANPLLGTSALRIAAKGKGDVRAILQRQIAGEWFLNCFLPISIGAATLLIEYYHSLRYSRARAFIIVYAPITLNTLFSFLLLAVLSPLTFSHLAVELNIPSAIGWIIPVGFIVILLTSMLIYKFWSRVKRSLKEFFTGLRMFKNIRIALPLVLISLLTLLINGVVLWLCAAALSLPLSFIGALILYVVSLLVGNILPIPGGIGAVEATLALGLTGSGMSFSDSLAVTLLFRLVSFWIPIIPGGIAFVSLRKELGSMMYAKPS